MKKQFLSFISLLAILAFSTLARADQFPIFDTTSYLNKPDLSQYGLKTSLKIVSAPQISPLYTDFTQVPSALALHDLYERLKKERVTHVALDFEQWSQRENDADETAKKYVALLTAFHKAVPGIKVGIYGAVPVGNIKIGVKDAGSKKYLEWQALSNRFQSLVPLVDFLAPSLYTPLTITTPQAWEDFAKAQIAEARRMSLGKPVYPFIWPVITHPDRTLDYLPNDFWKFELDVVRNLADGTILWGGWMIHDKREIWDSDAPWWSTIKSFAANK